MDTTVVACDPRSDARWNDLAVASGSLFTSPPWIRAVCDTYGFVPHARMTVDPAGVAQDGFAWVAIDDIRGERLVSLPFSDRAEPILSDPAVWPSLAHDALDGPAGLNIRCLEGSVPSDPRLQRVGEAAWHATGLDAPAMELFQSLNASTRRDVAAARGLGIRVDDSVDIDALRAYHAIHLTLRKRKYRLLAQPVEFFERIWDEFSGDDSIVTLLAYAGEELVGGAVLLAWGDTLYCKFAASLAGALTLRPNYAVFWHAIQWAVERGFRLLDWGLTDLDQPGLLSYKRKWACRESRIVTYRSPTSARLELAETGPLLEGLTSLFTDDTVPDAATARAGSLLYRYFT
jgi:hypothetical protein